MNDGYTHEELRRTGWAALGFAVAAIAGASLLVWCINRL